MEREFTPNIGMWRRIGVAVGLGVAVVLAAYSAQDNARHEPVCEPANPEMEESIGHTATATTYWIGEPPSPENDFISNVPSAWERNSTEIFGGIDDPEGRDFTPEHNTFYFALPAAEFTREGLIPGAREASPWADEAGSLAANESLFKGRWIEVCHEDSVIYAQWHDIGPNEYMDYGYVFGADEPANTFGQKAGLDLSPDASDALGLDGSGTVTWRFVEETDVPDGPWRKYPPISNKTNWQQE